MYTAKEQGTRMNCLMTHVSVCLGQASMVGAQEIESCHGACELAAYRTDCSREG
jgi:hypothetical protein